ncbi:MAG: hypothetical protein ACK6AD_15250 [Cyanobacteriota bacterium]
MRRRLAAWVAAGVAPPNLAPAAVAAAHLRVSGRPAARDPQRRGYRIYSADELRAALIELAGRSPRPAPPPPPPLDPLPLLWHAAARRLALPSNRMLLLHQARLIALRERGQLVVAVIDVRAEWLPLVDARRDLVARALADTLARPVALELQEVAP